MHGEDAEMVANALFKTTTVLKYFNGTLASMLPRTHMPGNDRLPYVTLSRMAVESLVRDLLLNQQYRVEIWACPAGSRRDQQWQCVRKVRASLDHSV